MANTRLFVDFGSTFTKLVAFDPEAETLLGRVQVPSTVDHDVTIGLGAGLNILTGETGSGKSVIITALSLLLGLMTLESLSRIVSSVGFSSLGLLFVFFWLLVSFGSKLVVSYLIGDLLLEKIAANSRNRKIWAMVSGVLVYTLVASLPLVGWLIALLVTLFGLGALWFLGRSYWQKKTIAA